MPFRTTSKPILVFRTEHEAINEALERGDKNYVAYFSTPVAGAIETKMKVPCAAGMSLLEQLEELVVDLVTLGMPLSTMLRTVKTAHKASLAKKASKRGKRGGK